MGTPPTTGDVGWRTEYVSGCEGGGGRHLLPGTGEGGGSMSVGVRGDGDATYYRGGAEYVCGLGWGGGGWVGVLFVFMCVCVCVFVCVCV